VAPIVWDDLRGAKTAFTIHNLEYGADLIAEAMRATDFGTTVSPSYAIEVANHGSVRDQQHKFVGITNGIDTDIWNPMEDEFLPMCYDEMNVVEGKAAAKAELQDRLNMAKRDVPMAGRSLC
jgi:starch synthase